MENQSGEWTRLLYCTTGVLLRKLQHDRHLNSLTHIIVDEVLTQSKAASADERSRPGTTLIKLNLVVHSLTPPLSPPPPGPRAQRPIRLPPDHPEGRRHEEVGPAAHPHERHGGLQQVLRLLQPLPSGQHPGQDVPSGGEAARLRLE